MKISRILLVFATAGAAAVSSVSAQTIVTPTNPNGWLFFDGSSGTSPATITSAQPDNGNGSIQFNVNAGNQQPAAAFIFTNAIAVTSINSVTVGYDFLSPAGVAPNTSPTIRFLLSGLTNTTQVGRSDGSLGWYLNGATGVWTTESLSNSNVGDAFFFRIGGVGQASLDCKSTAGSFDDRRQDLSLWASTCNGTGGTFDLQTASVVGIEVDWGTFGTPNPAVDYADMVNWNFNTTGGTVAASYNFELDAGTPSAVTPEPATMTMMGLGLVGLMGMRRRKRSA